MLIEPVSITDSAIEVIKEIMLKKKIPANYGLRIGLENIGVACRPSSYILGFDKKSNDDLVYEVSNISIYIKKQEVLHVNGLRLHYVDEEAESGFLFEKED